MQNDVEHFVSSTCHVTAMPLGNKRRRASSPKAKKELCAALGRSTFRKRVAKGWSTKGRRNFTDQRKGNKTEHVSISQILLEEDTGEGREQCFRTDRETKHVFLSRPTLSLFPVADGNTGKYRKRADVTQRVASNQWLEGEEEARHSRNRSLPARPDKTRPTIHAPGVRE